MNSNIFPFFICPTASCVSFGVVLGRHIAGAPFLGLSVPHSYYLLYNMNPHVLCGLYMSSSGTHCPSAQLPHVLAILVLSRGSFSTAHLR